MMTFMFTAVVAHWINRFHIRCRKICFDNEKIWLCMICIEPTRVWGRTQNIVDLWEYERPTNIIIKLSNQFNQHFAGNPLPYHPHAHMLIQTYQIFYFVWINYTRFLFYHTTAIEIAFSTIQCIMTEGNFFFSFLSHSSKSEISKKSTKHHFKFVTFLKNIPLLVCSILYIFVVVRF